MTRPLLYVSYRRYSEAHIEAVRGFVAKLKAQGFGCIFDEDDPYPEEGWPGWIEPRMKEADFILLIASRGYREAIERPSTSKSRGVIFEYARMRDEIYHGAGLNRRVIPVLLRGEGLEGIPESLHSYSWFDVGTEEGFEALCLRLKSADPEDLPVQSEPEAPVTAEREVEAGPRRDPAQEQRVRIGWALLAVTLVAATVVAVWQRGERVGGDSNPLQRATIALLGLAPAEAEVAGWVGEALNEALRSELSKQSRIDLVRPESIAQIKKSAGILGEASVVELLRLRHEVPPDLAQVIVTGIWNQVFEEGQKEFRASLHIWQSGRSGVCRVQASIRPTTDSIGAEDVLSLASKIANELKTRSESGEFCPEDSKLPVEIIPSEPRALKLYSQSLLRWRSSADPAGARDLMLESLQLEPDHPILLWKLAQISWELGRIAESEHSARRAIEESSRLEGVVRLELLANCHGLLGEWSKAATSYESLLAMDPAKFSFAIERIETLSRSDLLPEERAALGKSLVLLRIDARGIWQGNSYLAESLLQLDDEQAELAAGLARQAAAVGKRFGVVALEADARLVEALALDRLGEYEKAETALDSSEELFRSFGNLFGQYEVSRERAIVLARQGSLQEARSLLEEYREFFLERGGTRFVAEAEVNLASVLISLGELERGAELALHAADYFKISKAPIEEATALLALGNALLGQRRFSEANRRYEAALETFRKFEDRANVSRTLNNLGESYACSGDLSSAEGRFSEALEIAEAIGFTPLVDYILGWSEQLAAGSVPDELCPAA